MENTDRYRGLHFDRRSRAIPGRLMITVAALIMFTLLWMFVPHGALYWLLLPVVGGLVWVASFGWRPALSVIHHFVHYLEEFQIQEAFK